MSAPYRKSDCHPWAVGLKGRRWGWNNLFHDGEVPGLMNEAAGLDALESAAATGEPAALFELAKALLDTDPSRTEELYRRAAELGETRAMHNLANILQRRGALDEARSWYQRAADLGLEVSLIGLGATLEKSDPDEARRLYQQAAELGQVVGMYRLALMLYPIEQDQGLEWLESAVALGYPRAMYRLALHLERRDPERTMVLLRRASEAGDLDAMSKLGWLLVDADETRQEGARWLTLAFQQGKPRPVRDPALWGRRARTRSSPLLTFLELPWLLLSAGLVVLVAVAVGFWPWGVLVIGVWLASGPLILLRAVEERIIRGLGSVRRPTKAEYQRLAIAWLPVADAADVDPRHYSLWVQKSARINAYATAGHTIAITEAAIARLPSDQLEAVLAHELGHHLGGHTWASLLRLWYSLPAIYLFSFAIFLSLAVTAALRSGNVATSIGIGVVVVGFLGYLVATVPIVGIIAVVLVLLPFGLLWVRRAQEFEADVLAASLGYGEALERLLIATAPASEKERPPLLRRVGETHPSNLERAQRLASAKPGEKPAT